MKYLNTCLRGLLFLMLLAPAFLVAQEEEILVTATRYEVATVMDQATELNAMPADFEAWIASHTAAWTSGETPADYTARLVQHPKAGWQYVASWQQGPDAVVVRFPLLLEGRELVLLEVGQFQACVCRDGETVDFAPERPACKCPEGKECQYFMGEWLH